MKTEILLFIAVYLYAIIYAFIEGAHDYYVIQNDFGNNYFSKKWHFYGAIQNALAFAPLFTAIIMFEWRAGIPITLGSGVLFWQLHDSYIGYMIKGKIDYLGSKGFDGKIKAVFQSGLQLMIVRIIFIAVTVLDFIRVMNGYFLFN